jgi:hypothetical protein
MGRRCRRPDIAASPDACGISKVLGRVCRFLSRVDSFWGICFDLFAQMSKMRGAGIVRKFATRSYAVRFESGLNVRNGDGKPNAVATSDAACDAFENQLAWYFRRNGFAH